MDEIAQVVIEENVDGMIISNTTITRPETLKTEDKDLVNQTGRSKTRSIRSSDTESSLSGGLSGTPLRDRSTQVVAEMYKRTNGRVPIIAVSLHVDFAVDIQSCNYITRCHRFDHHRRCNFRLEEYRRERTLWTKLRLVRLLFKFTRQWYDSHFFVIIIHVN